MSMTALLGVRQMKGLSGNSESLVESNSPVTPH